MPGFKGGAMVPVAPPPASGSGVHLDALVGFLSDGFWVVRCLWVNSPYYQVDHFLGGGPVQVVPSVEVRMVPEVPTAT